MKSTATKAPTTGSLAVVPCSAIHVPEWQSLLANYVTDVDDCGTYVLRLGEKETLKLWDQVDAQTIELKRLRAACFVFLEAVKHNGYGMEDAERAIRAALSPNVASQPTPPLT